MEKWVPQESWQQIARCCCPGQCSSRERQRTTTVSCCSSTLRGWGDCFSLCSPWYTSLDFARLRQKGNSAIINTPSLAFSQIMNCHPTDSLEERGHWLNSAEWSLLSKSWPPAKHRWLGITYQTKWKIKQKERKYQRKNVPISSSLCITTESAWNRQINGRQNMNGHQKQDKMMLKNWVITILLLNLDRKGKKIERKQMVSLAGGTNKQLWCFVFR